MATLEDLNRIADQSLEIMKLVSKGERDPDEVIETLDNILADGSGDPR